MALEPLSWTETRERIRDDRRRFAETVGAGRAPFLHPSFVCTVLHRVSHHLFRRDRRILARAVAQLNMVLTGADIAEPSDLGGGLVIVSPAGVSIYGSAGRNLTVMPLAGLGGQLGREEDVGAGPGLPLLGDDVVLEPYCGVLGPVRVGDRVRVCTGVALAQPVPDDSIVESPGHEPRVLRRNGA